MAGFGGLAQGYLDFTQTQDQKKTADLQRQMMAAELAAYQWQQQQEQQRRAAMQQWGPVLANYRPPQPPPPGQGSVPSAGAVPPMAAATQPGGGPPMGAMRQPMPAPPAAQMGPPAPGGMPPQGWKPMPQAPAPQPAPPPAAGNMGQPPPPPPAPAGQTGGGMPGVDQTQMGQYSLPNLINMLKQSNVPPEKWVDMLENLPDPIKNQAANEIKRLHDMNDQLYKWATLQERTQKDTSAQAEKEREDLMRDQDRNAKNAIARQRLQATSGKAGFRIVRWATDEDGNVTGGYDRAGHFHSVDEDAPKTSPKGDMAKKNQLAQLNKDRSALIAQGKPTDEIDAKIQALSTGKGGSATSAPGGIPPMPSSLPAGSQYSPSRRQWRDPSGKLFDETGAPVTAAGA